MKQEIREPISPLDCFYSPEKELSKKYMTFNLFDYYFYSKKGFDVINQDIKLESIFELIRNEYDNKERRIVSCRMGKNEYLINLHELYSYLWPGNAYKYAYQRVIEESFNLKLNIRYYYRKGGGKQRISIFKAASVIIENFIELIFNRNVLVEKHPSLKGKYVGNNLITNKIFNLIYKRKIKKFLIKYGEIINCISIMI